MCAKLEAFSAKLKKFAARLKVSANLFPPVVGICPLAPAKVRGVCIKDVHPKGGRGGFEIVDENGHGGRGGSG